MRVRSALISILFLFFSFCASGEVVKFFTPEMQWSFVTGLSLEDGKDFETDTSTVDFSAYLNMHQLQANAGFRFQPSELDFTIETVYWPEFWNRANFGVGSILHTNYYSDVFFEADFLFGVYAGYHTAKKFNCMLNFMYMGKAAKIYAIENRVPWLRNHSCAFKTEFNFRPIDRLNLFLTISSYSQYRYMLFLAPDFKLGGEFQIIPVLGIGAQLEIQYIDMFTLSSNLNSVDMRIYSRIMLK